MINNKVISNNIPHQQLILMISGKRTCGKDTVAKIAADYLISLASIIPQDAMLDNKKLEQNIVEIVSFAKILKFSFCRDFGYEFDKMMNDYSYKEEHRSEMTHYFMKMRYIEGEDYFSNELINSISQHQKDGRIVIVSDLRLKGDLERFRELDRSIYKVVTIRVNSTEDSRSTRGWVKKQCDTDFTETDLDNCTDFDFVIDNDGTLDELKDKVVDILLKI